MHAISYSIGITDDIISREEIPPVYNSLMKVFIHVGTSETYAVVFHGDSTNASLYWSHNFTPIYLSHLNLIPSASALIVVK